MEFDDLEYFANKSQYHKILSTVDVSKYNLRQEYISNLNIYRDEIAKITHNMLHSPDRANGLSKDIHDSFEAFVKVCCKHLDNIHNDNSYDDSGFDDENMYDESDYVSKSDAIRSKSLWGDTIIKNNRR